MESEIPFEMRAARAISFVGHPFLLVPLVVGAVSLGELSWYRALAVALAVAALTSLPMLFVIRRKVVAGAWTDHDVSDQSQRRGFYLVAVAVIAASSLAFWLLGFPRGVVAGTAFSLVPLVVATVVNRWTKISLHMIFGAYFAVILFRVNPWVGVGAMLFIAAVGWSRVVLGRHTLQQVVLGVALGTASGALLLAVLC